ncbi:MAG: 3,4-dihydroxy-2-butanone-4-phosphate synthase, partial [Burkholderiales bacterium]|nr:3,4-dihydroxy-2-butanone-4-phosphate synthase [Burkholderiales bacterium]
KDDGDMARLPDLMTFADVHGLKIGTIADLIQYRSRTESLVRRVHERTVRTVHGDFRLIAYSDETTREAHLALVRGQVAGEEPVLVRVHEPLSVVDALDLGSSTHSWSLHDALAMIARAGRGVAVLLHRTETGTDLISHLQAQPATGDRHKMDLRTYGIGAQILRDLGVKRMRLLSQPRKMPSMTGFDLEVAGYELPGPRQADTGS